jgi:undecaprenyl-diphosphatase
MKQPAAVALECVESGRWHLFGIYCLIAAVAVSYLHHLGY